MKKFIIKILTNLLLRKAKGFRTILIGVLAVLIPIVDWAAGAGLYELLCNWIKFFCDIDKSEFYVWFVGFLGSLQVALRIDTDTKVGKKK